MADPTPVIERAIEEASKMDIQQLRGIAAELDASAEELAAFRENPTDYLKAKINYIPEGFHAHYAEGRNLDPAELVEEDSPTERFAFSIPIGEKGTLSSCVVCWDNCCRGDKK